LSPRPRASLCKHAKALREDTRRERGAGVEKHRAVVSKIQESVGKSIVPVSVCREAPSE